LPGVDRRCLFLGGDVNPWLVFGDHNGACRGGHILRLYVAKNVRVVLGVKRDGSKKKDGTTTGQYATFRTRKAFFLPAGCSSPLAAAARAHHPARRHALRDRPFQPPVNLYSARWIGYRRSPLSKGRTSCVERGSVAILMPNPSKLMAPASFRIGSEVF